MKPITTNTLIIIKKDLETPYHYFVKGEYRSVEKWAKLFGISSQRLLKDLKNGEKTEWFEVYV